jgi:RimJ/RimL family protein N-acetyltransferase
LAAAQRASNDIGMQPLVITNELLLIRPLANADIEPIYQGCQDPDVQKWTVAIPVPYTRSDAEWFVRENAPDAWAQDRAYIWGIEDPDSRTLIGVIDLRPLGDGCSEVGYWLAPHARGRGAMTQALSAVCRFAFDELGNGAVRWNAIVGNGPSRRVAERVGFEISTPIRGLLNQRGTWVDGWMGTLLATDTPPPRPPELTDGVVTIRPPRAGDLASLPDLVDDEVLAWTGVPSRSPEELARWFEAIRHPGSPPAGRFAITGADDRPCGYLRLSLEQMSGSVSMGWWLGPSARGKGFAYRGVRLASAWAVMHGAHRLTASIFDGNRASMALAERLGMTREGMRRAYWPPRKAADPYRDTWLYGTVAGDPGWPVAGDPGWPR